MSEIKLSLSIELQGSTIFSKEECLKTTQKVITTKRGTSEAMIAGAMLNELHNINPTTKTYILIVKKDSNTSTHCSSLRGIDEVGTMRFIVVVYCPKPE